MRKKVRSTPLTHPTSPPLRQTAATPRRYPMLHELFGATPEMRSWVAARLASMARHAAVAGVTVTALGCGHGDTAPPTPAVTPVVEHATPPPALAPSATPVAPSAPSPAPAPTPAATTPAAGAPTAPVAEDTPCPDHPGGHIVPAARVARMTAAERARFHSVLGSPATQAQLAAALAGTSTGNLNDIGQYSMGGGCPAFRGDENIGGGGTLRGGGGTLEELHDAGAPRRRHRTPQTGG